MRLQKQPQSLSDTSTKSPLNRPIKPGTKLVALEPADQPIIDVDRQCFAAQSASSPPKPAGGLGSLKLLEVMDPLDQVHVYPALRQPSPSAMS